MSIAHIFPAFRERWIHYEDDDVVVVDKPPFVSCQESQEGRKDDLVARLKHHLALSSRTSREPYVGIHQRLDRDTSGLVLYAKRKEANASLARQFESRSIGKTYAAIVASPWRGKPVLQDWLEPPRQGVVTVARQKTRTSLQATTRVVLEKRAPHASLLALTLETGRTHQARVQLSHAGSPIIGCALYGGAPASRLYLHARALELEHPQTGKALALRTSLPDAFSRYLETPRLDGVYDTDDALLRQLEEACDRRYDLVRGAATDVFRLVNDVGDGLPRLVVDVYGAYAVAQFYEDDETWGDSKRSERVLDALRGLGFRGVYAKWRPKQANTIVTTRTEARAPKNAVRGESAEECLTVRENGVAHVARLGDGLSTGIFLDQRDARALVQARVKGKSVLNLFAYQCAFSVAAAAGGAKRTVSVDVSALALERGRESFGERLSPSHEFVAEDVFRFLARAAKKGDMFDWVILDPPSYSTTKERRFVAESDYADLAAMALRLVRPGGFLLASMNHRKTSKQRFRKQLFEAARQSKREVVKIRDLPESIDFPAQNGTERYLKSALVELAR